MGHQFDDLRHIIENVEQTDRLGVCLDTCHVFAAGYDLRTSEGYEDMWKQFDTLVGRERLKAIHLNDSKNGCGTRKDRHEHIGKGHLGIEPFQFLMNDERLTNIPMILETEKDKEMTEDVENMSILRGLVTA
jgi:deoxyribonuclease-4